MMTAARYKSSNNDNGCDNNKDKVCLLLKRSGLVSHILDHMRDYVLNHLLDSILDKMIIDFITTALQLELLNFLINSYIFKNQWFYRY